ncbi:DUF1392 family protein [Nostoc favosum]|uniref:DUF1392 domain-containing protein n=1 Tax=Nostoc favosum CHAB5714 TaxID=2780399 RepID=A0ABS8I8W1_9NOSO|nr:DUF1392 domain-containing protein [Nostoc favosum CHAB5714]
MINLVQNLETCWYLSPSWGKEIPRNFSQTIKNKFTSLDIRHFLIHHQLKFMMVNKVGTK